MLTLLLLRNDIVRLDYHIKSHNAPIKCLELDALRCVVTVDQCLSLLWLPCRLTAGPGQGRYHSGGVWRRIGLSAGCGWLRDERWQGL